MVNSAVPVRSNDTSRSRFYNRVPRGEGTHPCTGRAPQAARPV